MKETVKPLSKYVQVSTLDAGVRGELRKLNIASKLENREKKLASRRLLYSSADQVKDLDKFIKAKAHGLDVSSPKTSQLFQNASERVTPSM